MRADAGRGFIPARDFVARARLYSFPPQNLDDASLLALLRGQLRAGELAVLREGKDGAAGEDASDVKQRRLAREIEAKSRSCRLAVLANVGPRG